MSLYYFDIDTAKLYVQFFRPKYNPKSNNLYM